MANPQHLEWLKEGVEAWNKRRSTSSFIPNFENANLEGMNLEETNLEGAILWRANLRKVDLSEADLQRANLEEANLEGAKLPKAIMAAAILRGANLYDASLQQTILHAADLQGAILQKANLERADLEEADLEGADLHEAIFQRAILRGGDLRGANLLGANLQGADLHAAMLPGAILQEANLRDANLQGVDLRGAFLQETKLHEANACTIKSILDKQTASRVDFTLTLDMTQAQVDSMLGDTGVRLPQGLVHPNHWPVWEEETDDDNDTQDQASRAINQHTQHTTTDTDAARSTELLHSTVAQSHITSRISENKLDVVDGPPKGQPAASDENDQSSLFRGIETGCGMFLKRFRNRPHNIPNDVADAFETTRTYAIANNSHWYQWDQVLSSIKDDLDQYADAPWAGTRKNAEKVAEQIKDLEKYLKLNASPECQEEVKDKPVQIGPYSEAAARDLAAAATTIINIENAGTVMTGNATNFFSHQETSLRQMAEALDPIPGSDQAKRREKQWSKIVFNLAGAVAAGLLQFTTGIAAAVTVNVLTNETAGAILQSKLQEAWEVLLRVLSIGP